MRVAVVAGSCRRGLALKNWLAGIAALVAGALVLAACASRLPVLPEETGTPSETTEADSGSRNGAGGEGATSGDSESGVSGTEGETATAEQDASGSGDGGGPDTVGNGDDASDPDTPQRGGALRVLLAADPTPITGWTPWEHVCAWSCRNVLDHVLETLTVVLPDGSVAPWLAASVESDDSLQRWTVRLRPGITFSDGEPVNALVIKNGIDDLIRSGRASGGHVRDNRLSSVIVESEDTLVFELSEPNAGLPAALAGPLGRVFSVDAAEVDPDGFAAAPVGTGPFTFSQWAEGAPTVLKRNPNYWRSAADGSKLPYLDEIVFTEIADERDRLEALLAGDADVMMTRSPEASAAVATAHDTANRPLQVVRNHEDNAGAVLFNLLRAPLDDVRVRRALLAAVSQAELVRALGLAADAQAATQWWAPGSIWHSDQVAQAWPGHDPERAIELLREYTEDPERSDDRDPGEPVQITLLCTDDFALGRMTEALATAWRSTGLVEVTVEPVARTGLISRVMGSVVQSPSFAGDFDATCWRVGGESDPGLQATVAVGPVRTTPLNVSNFTGEHLTDLASLIRSTPAGDERRAAVAQFMLELTNEAPWVYLSYASSALAASADVGGFGGITLTDGAAVAGQRLGVGRYEALWLRRP